MKKNFLWVLLFLIIPSVLNSQTPTAPPKLQLSPGGNFENIFDRFGNKYRLEDLLINKPTAPPVDDDGMGGRIESTVTPAQLLCTAGYFDLYFENGSGMENGISPDIDRRNVICQLFTDISNFIVPVNPSAKVNIWVRDINNIIPGAYTSGILGVASSFYTPPNLSAGSAGIIDGEIWRTINTGADGYTNVTSPLLAQNLQSAGGSGAFYHGMVAFNFNQWNINWHTDLTNATVSGLYDLYSVALHEITHALGFASLIDYNGDSKFGTVQNYYSRYDLFLQDQSTVPLIETLSSCSMYDYAFNSLLNASTLLSPNPATCGSSIPFNGSLDNTTCSTAVIFAGTVNQAVYTPDCFEPPSSLSHLEDQCYSPTPYGNNQYYCMSNANGSGPTYMKRYLKPEERNVLCDIGYKVNTTFGNTLYTANNYNYGGSQCATMDVAGVNDGVNTGGTYTWYVTTSGTVNISGSGLLTNDYNADEFECLEVMNGLGIVNITNGTSTTTVTFTAGTSTGVALLRYIPVNTTTGNRGNITYAYVYVYSGNCQATACNMVMNGDFESGTNCGQQNYCCPSDNAAIDCWNIIDGTPDYFVRNCLSSPIYTVPTIFLWGSNPVDTWNNGANNNDAFVGMFSYLGGSWYAFESEQTILATPIMPNTTYTISFWARSVVDGSSIDGPGHVMFRADVGPVVGVGYVTSFNYGEYLTDAFIPGDGDWHYFSKQFTYNGTQTLYNLMVASVNVSGYGKNTYIFLDDVVLNPSSNVAAFLPPTGDLCVGITSIANLADYVFPAPPTGATFSGPGVSFNGTSYSFTSPGIGLYTIFYNYTNNLGCNITVPAQIYGSTFQAPVVPMYSAFSLGGLYSDGSHIGNGVEGYYTGIGHILSGVMYPNAANGLTTEAAMVVRTNYSGSTGGGTTFNNTYEFVDNISGSPLRVNSTRIIELMDGSGYIAVSGFSVNRATPPHQNNQVFGVLYMELDLNGNIVSSKKFPIAPFVAGVPLTITNITVTALKQLKEGSTPDDEFVIAGQVMDGEETQIFVIHIDRKGNLHWGGGQMYDLPGQPASTQEMPLDIIESPFNPYPSDAELYVVGYVDVLGMGRDAFILSIDPAMGTPINFEVYDFNGQFDAFTGITAVDYKDNPGYAVCGYTHSNPFNQGEVLVMKFDKYLIPQWSYTYDDMDQPGNVHEAYSIVDIPNCETGEYTFNVAGSRNYFSMRDVISIPLDDKGTATQMDISDLGDDEYAVSVDYIPTGAVTIFGQHTDISQVSNCYIMFSCFSGQHNVLQTPVNPNPTSPPYSSIQPFMIEDALVTNIINNNDQLLCLAYPSINNPSGKGDDYFNGNNMALDKVVEYPAMKKENPSITSIYPNPATDMITLQMAKDIAPDAVIKVELQNILGQTVKVLHTGKVNGKVSLSLPEVAEGVYLIQVYADNQTVLKEKLIIKK